MNDLRKAAEMALEALEEQWEEHEAIDELRQALSNEFNPDWNQVEALQESLREHMVEIQRLRQALAQPEQEPVRWINFNAATGQESIDDYCDSELASIPLYTAPSRRKWVGLTDEEVNALLWKLSLGAVDEDVRTIEAKIKEKNT